MRWVLLSCLLLGCEAQLGDVRVAESQPLGRLDSYLRSLSDRPECMPFHSMIKKMANENGDIHALYSDDLSRILGLADQAGCNY